MNRRHLLSLTFAAVLGLGGFALAESVPGTNAGATTQPAVDVHNTKCIVSGDDVGSSKLTAVYDGKIYHFCCGLPGHLQERPRQIHQSRGR